MTPDAQKVLDAISEHSDRITALQGQIGDWKAGQKEDMKAAIVEGLREILQDRDVTTAFWSGAFDSLSDRGVRGAGKFVLGGAGTLFKFLLWAALALVVLFQFGGWPAVLKGLKWWSTSP